MGVQAQTAPAPDAKLLSAFQADCGAKFDAADKAGNMSVPGKDGWLFWAKELRHIRAGKFWGEAAAKVTQADKPEWGDPLPAILDLKDQLDKLGIQLVLVPVPPKAIVYPDKVSDLVVASAQAPVVPRLDPFHQEFYKLLRDKGIAVIDLTDDFIKARSNDKDDQREYCKTDTHWSPFACELAAKRIAETIGNKLGQPQLHNPFKSDAQTLEFAGDMGKDGGAKETLQIHVVSPSGDDPKVTDTVVDKDSPVLLMGDSHCLVFHAGGDMLASGAGLADQLAFRLCAPVELVGVRGSGATNVRRTLMQKVQANPQYLTGAKVVVWCFTSREFTEASGWRLVPLMKTPKK